MRRFKVASMVVVVAVFFSMVLFDSLAFAKAYQQPPGEPPRGLKVEGASGGTKLAGVITIEEFNVTQTDTFSNAKIVLRLQLNNSNDPYTFYGQIEGVTMDASDPATIQGLIEQTMSPQILEYFFNCYQPDCKLKVTLKNVTKFSFVDAGPTINTTFSRFVVADVELAVK